MNVTFLISLFVIAVLIINFIVAPDLSGEYLDQSIKSAKFIFGKIVDVTKDIFESISESDLSIDDPEVNE